MSSRPTRRAVLSAGAVGLVAACTRSHRPPSAGRPARPDPDVALTAAAVDRELALLAAYDAALAATPALASRLAPLRAEHAEHLSALGSGPARKSTPSPATDPAPDAGPGGTGPRGVQARRSLVTVELAAAAAHAAAALTASARLAAVLASLAASEASHQVALG